MNNSPKIDEINLLENVYQFIIPKYHEINDMIVSLLDFNSDKDVRIADLGAGVGTLSKRVFDIFPNATVFGVDSNEQILNRSGELLNHFKDQYIPILKSLENSTWIDDVGELDAIISAFTLDFLPLENHKHLIKESFEKLHSHGRWVSCEFFRSEDPLINRIFHDVEIKFVQKSLKDGRITQEQIGQLSQLSFLAKPHHVCTLQTKIDWLRMAGFEKIEIPWKFLNLAIISAVKP
jgi:ubiquinone/menaquinone biosynthesis C-methylase UbiE